MNPDCLPCAGVLRPTSRRPVGRKVFLHEIFCRIIWPFSQHFKISDSSTPTMGKQSQIIIFSGGHWTAEFRALRCI
jgi:hypothetical protein